MILAMQRIVFHTDVPSCLEACFGDLNRWNHQTLTREPRHLASSDPELGDRFPFVPVDLHADLQALPDIAENVV